MARRLATGSQDSHTASKHGGQLAIFEPKNSCQVTCKPMITFMQWIKAIYTTYWELTNARRTGTRYHASARTIRLAAA